MVSLLLEAFLVVPPGKVQTGKRGGVKDKIRMGSLKNLGKYLYRPSLILDVVVLDILHHVTMYLRARKYHCCLKSANFVKPAYFRIMFEGFEVQCGIAFWVCMLITDTDSVQILHSV